MIRPPNACVRDSVYGRLRLAANIALGRHGCTRCFSVFDDDLAICAFPKSGTHWACFLLANLLNPGVPTDFTNIESRVANFDGKFTERRGKEMRRPRIVRTHAPFNPRFRRVLMLVRDPRDVAVSYYHYFILERVIDESASIQGFVEEFVSGSIRLAGSWGEHVGGWLGARENTHGFLLMRYEGMLSDPAR